MCLGLVAMLGGGCDQSKQELESTKSSLDSVTKERDDLKTQVATLQKELDTTKAELTKAKTPPPAVLAVKTTPAKKEAAGRSKHAH
jgi:septal ring factor EnvC (AmiA/AmiB activator)